MFFKLGALRPSALELYLKETTKQVLSCEICQIFKNNFFTEDFQ